MKYLDGLIVPACHNLMGYRNRVMRQLEEHPVTRTLAMSKTAARRDLIAPPRIPRPVPRDPIVELAPSPSGEVLD